MEPAPSVADGCALACAPRRAVAMLLGRAQDRAPLLTSLDLSSTQLGDGGLAVLAEGVRLSTHLQHLNLANNGCGLPGARALADALAVNTSLTSLDVRGCDADEAPGVDDAARNAAAAAGQAIVEVRQQRSLLVLGEALLRNPHSRLGHVSCDAFNLCAPRRALAARPHSHAPSVPSLAS